MIQLGSVNLIVKDIKAAEKFYVDVLGLKVDHERSNRPSFVLLRTANCMVILQEEGAIEQTGNGNAETGFELAFEVDDVESMREKLGDRARIQQMGWGNAIETLDPNGTRLNLYQWR